MGNILMTGITGLVGSAFASKLLATDKNIKIIAIARDQGEKDAETRVKEVITEQCKIDGIPEFAKEALKRIKVCQLNILNSIRDCYLKTFEDIETIFHCAADVNLGKDTEGKTFNCNFQGTKNLLELAHKLKVKSFHFVSTAYVAGKAHGTIIEDDLIENPDFNNSYEKSKYCSEQLVRNSKIPFTIYRPSIIIGDLEHGKIRKPLAFYRLLEFMGKIKKKGCLKLNIPLNKAMSIHVRLKAHMSDKIYFVPIDYVQKTITKLFFLQPSNKTYHITGKSPTSVEDIRKAVCSILKLKGLSITTNILTPTTEEKIINRNLSDLLPYFSTNIAFDVKNVVQVAGEASLNWTLNYDTVFKIIAQYYKDYFPELVS